MPTAKPKPRKRKATGSKPGESTAARARKHALIVKKRLQGLAWETVAAEVGMSERQCRKVWTTWRDERKPFIEGLDPIDYVVEMAGRLDTLYETLALIASDEKAQHSARVGAVNGQRQTLQAQIELLQETGLLPRNLGRLAVEVDIRHVAVELRMFLQRRLSEDEFDDAAEELQSILRRDATGRPLELVRGD